jgi:hypothetical protein
VKKLGARLLEERGWKEEENEIREKQNFTRLRTNLLRKLELQR